MDSFNLIDDAWIKVVDLDGAAATVGVREFFQRAPLLRRMDGELPTQDVAVLRFLLAIVLLAVADPRRNVDQAIADWATWWSDWTRLEGHVQGFLERHGPEFELFGPDAAFHWVADLEPAGKLEQDLARLLPEHGRWFSTRQGPQSERITAAEAARWLLHAQAYDDAGIKTGAAGDPAVSGGKGYPTGYPAWAGNVGMVVIQGATLVQTILLNLPLGDYPNEEASGWARPQPVFRRADQTPRGAAELFTWPNRRIRLIRDEVGHVIGSQISYGDTLTPQNMNALEPMGAWRLSETQTKKAKTDVLMPVQHDPNRQLWRGLTALLADRASRPATLEWLELLRQDNLLDPDLPIRILAVGVEYGPNNSGIQSLISDALSAELIAVTDPGLRELIARCAESTRPVVGALAHLGALLAQATHSDEAGARDRAAVRGYTTFDPVFRRWLVDVSDPADEIGLEVRWQRALKRAGLKLGAELCREAGVAGARFQLIGERQVDTSSAWSWFNFRLSALTPLATSEQAGQSEPTTNPQPDQDEEL